MVLNWDSARSSTRIEVSIRLSHMVGIKTRKAGFCNFWDGKFEAGTKKIAGTVVTTNRTSFACSNSCGDAKKFKNLFNLLFTGQGLNATVKSFASSAVGNDIEAILTLIILTDAIAVWPRALSI